ncbi:MAG: hypothetical protein KatS3mg112_0392 [Thermogutta sp.]|nr:MAG: hypothetical protein KatS3mg112_0392 [Thermogutta sp.]
MNCPYTMSEGPACRVRRATFDYRFPFPGHDKRAPPIFRKPFRAETSLGGTCLSRPPFNVGSSIAFRRGLKSRAESGAKAPHSIWGTGHDKGAPPEKVSPTAKSQNLDPP